MFKFEQDVWEVAEDHIWSVKHLVSDAQKRNIPHPTGMIETLFYNLQGISGTWENEPLESLWHLPIAQEFRAHPLWRELKSELKSDKVNCAIAAINLVGGLIKQYNFYNQFVSFPYYDFQEAEDSLEYADEMGLDKVDILAEIERAKTDLKEFAVDLSQSDPIKSSVDFVLKDILASVRKESITSDGRSYLPCFDGHDLASQVNAVQAVDGKRLKQVLKALGWLKLGMGHKRVKTSHVKTSGMDFGNDISSILPSEFLKHNYVFGADFAEEKLWQHKQQKQRGESGDFFLLFDWSGSMLNNLEGLDQQDISRAQLLGEEVDQILRVDWGKAVFLKVLEICRKQKRQVWVVPFTNYTLTSKCKKFDSQTPGEEVTKFLKDTSNVVSGTNWEPPLEWAIERIQKTGKRTMNGRWKNSDILYVTDADGYKVVPEFVSKVKRLKQQLNINVHVILISQNDVEQKLLSTIADKVINIGKVSVEQVALQAGELLLSYE